MRFAFEPRHFSFFFRCICRFIYACVWRERERGRKRVAGRERGGRGGGTGNRGLSFVAAPSKSHKIIICKREFISKNIYGLLGLQEPSRNLYMYMYECICVCVCAGVGVWMYLCVCVGVASLQSCLHVASLLALPPLALPVASLLLLLPLSLTPGTICCQPKQMWFFLFHFPHLNPNVLPSCSVPVPFVIDSLLSKLVSIDFQLVVFVVAAKILIDSISNRRYFLQQWGNVIRKCFRH